MKRILNISIIVLLTGAIIGLSVYFYVEYRNQKVNQISINIFRSRIGKGFLSKSALLKEINKDSVLSNKTLKEIDIKLIEKQLKENPYVAGVDVFLDITGGMIINIKEKNPLVRIYTLQGSSFYIDNNGTLFPTAKNYAPHVIIANGYIKGVSYNINRTVTDSIYKTTPLQAIYSLASKIVSDDFLKAAISQIYINSKKQIDLIPEIGNEIIRFGTMENANIKLQNLKAFYQKAYIKEGGGKYSQINLQYINQVVCTKK